MWFSFSMDWCIYILILILIITHIESCLLALSVKSLFVVFVHFLSLEKPSFCKLLRTWVVVSKTQLVVDHIGDYHNAWRRNCNQYKRTCSNGTEAFLDELRWAQPDKEAIGQRRRVTWNDITWCLARHDYQLFLFLSGRAQFTCASRASHSITSFSGFGWFWYTLLALFSELATWKL